MLSRARLLNTVVAALAFILSAVGTAVGATFYVADDGRDSWSGRLAAPNPAQTDGPFATLEGALAAARVSPGADRILLRPGLHVLRRPIVLGPDDSGLTIEGEDNRVVVSGGRRVIGWQPVRGRVLSARLDALDIPDLAFRELYYNDRLQVWARVPNFDPRHPRTGGFLQNAAVVEPGTKTKLQYREGALQPERWAHPERAWVMFHDSLNYETQLCPVRAVDTRRRVIEAERGVYALSVGNPFYVCGVLEELDAPGEWCVDPDTRTLHFWPPSGNPNGRDRVVVPALASAFVLQGDAAAGRWVEEVRIAGLAIRDLRGRAVTMSGARRCVVARCDLRNAEVGVFIGDDTHACRVSGCDITQTQGDGVSIIGTSTDHERVTDHVVDNCYIWDFGWGRIHNRCGGVYMHRCARCRLTHNHVHDGPRYALAMDVGNDCEFAYNLCHHVNLVTTDSGIIEAATALDWGLSVEKQRERHRPHNWGNKIHHNLLYDSGGWNTSPDGRLLFPSFTWGIYLDLDCSGWHVYDNVCYNTVLGGFMLNGGTDNVVENNILVDGQQHQIQWNPWSGYTMARNRCERNIFSYAGSPAHLYALGRFEGDEVRFARNLIHARNGAISIAGVRDLPREGTWTAWQQRGQDAGSLVADPLFVRPARRDYRLRPESPALKLGHRPIDLSRVGNYADADRRTWPRPEVRVARDKASYEPGTASVAEQPPLRTYENYAVGEKERGAHVGDEAPLALVSVTDETAASGRHSLKFAERPGVTHSFVPYCTYPLEKRSGVLRSGFDLRWEKGAHFVYEWRDDPYSYRLGPRLEVDPVGHLTANGRPVMDLEPGRWVRLDVVCGLGPQSGGTYDLTIRPAGGASRMLRHLAHDEGFRTLNCVVVMSIAQGDSVFYLDNLGFTHARK